MAHFAHIRLQKACLWAAEGAGLADVHVNVLEEVCWQMDCHFGLREELIRNVLTLMIFKLTTG